MRLSIALLTSALASSDAANNISTSRKLAFEKVAGYAPGSQVTDHCAIDLDQAAIEAQLALKTPEAFDAAKKIYEQGGNSKSYALVTLVEPLPASVAEGDTIFGKNADGNEVSGKAYQDYDAGSSVTKVQYKTSDTQDTYMECQVGGMVGDAVNLKGCLVDNGDLTIGDSGRQYAYTYAGFSTGAMEDMRTGCAGCPYEDHTYFYNYYGTDRYADEWIEAAFEGRQTAFTNGNADFGKYTFDGKEQVIKKGTAYLAIFANVIKAMENAIDDCNAGCIDCNNGYVHAWDEAVCFYTGSMEGQVGTDDGKLLHQLADKRCADFKVCGEEGTDLNGMAKINHDIFDMFDLGNYQLNVGECDNARVTAKKIIKMMYIPLIQGTQRYTYEVSESDGGEAEQAKGAAFAAAVLPRIHAANSDAAATIYNNMKVGNNNPDFKAVKSAFESTYAQLGITCADVGGLWDVAAEDYYPGMEPCGLSEGGAGGEATDSSPTSVAGAGSSEDGMGAETTNSTAASVAGVETTNPTATSVAGVETTSSTAASVAGDETTNPTTTSVAGDETTDPTTTSVAGDETTNPTDTSIAGDETTNPTTTSVAGDETTNPTTTSIAGGETTNPTDTSIAGVETTNSTATSVADIETTNSTSASVAGVDTTNSTTTSVAGVETTNSTAASVAGAGSGEDDAGVDATNSSAASADGDRSGEDDVDVDAVSSSVASAGSGFVSYFLALLAVRLYL